MRPAMFFGNLQMLTFIRGDKTTARGRIQPPTSLIRPAKYMAHFFKCHVSECGQQCNKIGCCLSRKSHGIWPSSGRAITNSGLGSKRLATPGLHELNRQSQPSRGGCHICELQDQPLTFCERFDASIILSTGSPACTRSVFRCM